jgi:type IV pilus assembly protein PilW
MSNPPLSAPRYASQGGLSLIELMVAITIAALLLLGLSTLFAASSRNFAENEKASRQIENGRYAMDLIAEDLRHAGFYGEVGNVTTLPITPIPLPTSMPGECDTGATNLSNALPIPVQGKDAPDTTTCIASADYVTGTDVVVIRRANTTTIAAASAVASEYYTQTAFCSAATSVFKLDTTSFTGSGALKAKDCATDAPLRKYHVHVYYISPCSVGTGGGGACQSGDKAIPTLKRLELGSSGYTIRPLVEGIENLQFEYGLDTNNDGNPDTWTANPTGGTAAAIVTAWSQVVAVRVYLVARNVDQTGGYTDTKTYSMGNDRNGAAVVYNPGGAYKRHGYSELIRLTDVAQRKESAISPPSP